MKKRRLLGDLRSLILIYLIFFVFCAFVVTSSFLMFFNSIELSEEQVRASAPITFINILIITEIFVVLDIVHRKITVDRPVKQIKNALSQITEGQFNIRLDTQGSNRDFAEVMESINIMASELSGVETLRTDFIANVSHEMKTPLAVMQNYGTMLQAPGLPEEKRIEYAKAITEGSRRLADLMTNILKLNRLENQQIYPQEEEYDLGEQLCECLLQFEDVWEKKSLNIETNIEEGVTVRSDAELLGHVWNNLFSNAIKFTEPGGTVSVSLTSADGYAIVKVSDTGCGMTPEVGAHIFDKFYQGDTSHATQGNGLGLALVKRVVDIMRGEIHVESVHSKGSTFTVKFRVF